MSEPRLIAHRGYAGVAPENTLTAFDTIATGRHPADMIEFDVMPSSDGDPVVFHDHRLDGRGRPGARGITDSAGIVWETSTRDITQAEVLGSGSFVPTLSEVVEAVPPTIGLNVELRNPGMFDIRFGETLPVKIVRDHRETWDPFVERVLSDLDAGEHEVLFCSFAEAAIAAARDLAPDIPAGVNVYDSLEDGFTILDRYDCAAIHPRLNMVRGTSFFESSRGSIVDPDFGDIDVVTEAHERGAEVNVWTIKTWREAMELERASVDGLIADYPGLRNISKG